MNHLEKFVEKFGRLPTERDPDYLEQLRMSRYRILDVPDIKPAKCANCGTSKKDGRKYIDFGLEFDWYGIVFLCSFCLTDIASNMGLFNDLRSEVSKLQNKLLGIRKDVMKGIGIRNDFLVIFKEVQDYIASLPAISDEPTPDSGVVVDKSEASGSKSTVTPIKRDASEAKSGTTKQNASGGSENVPSLAKLLQSGS